MRRCLVIWLILSSAIGLIAQGPNFNWLIGDSILLSDDPSQLSVNREVPLFGREAVSSHSLPDGTLLYYTNGIEVRNRDDAILAGSEDLLTWGTAATGSTISQGALFLPLPGDDQNRYCYLILYSFDGVSQFGWTYSLIDLAKDGGLGGVSDSIQNLFFSKNPTEQLHAVRKSDQESWWIFTRSSSSDSSRFFRRTLLDSSGFKNYPPIDCGMELHARIGEITSSPDGCYLASVGYTTDTPRGSIAVFNLNRGSGLIELIHGIQFEDDSRYYSAAFSPSSNLLYVNKFFPHPEEIIQINFTSEPIQILPIASPVNSTFLDFGEMELASDGRIYFPTIAFGPLIADDHDNFLGTINYPDSLGPACNIDLAAIDLGDNIESIGISDFPNYVEIPGNCLDTVPDTVTVIDNFVSPVLEIYPSISDGLFHLHGTVDIVEVYNTSGVLIQAFQHVTYFDLGNVSPGLYVILLRNENGDMVSRKILVY